MLLETLRALNSDRRWTAGGRRERGEGGTAGQLGKANQSTSIQYGVVVWRSRDHEEHRSSSSLRALRIRRNTSSTSDRPPNPTGTLTADLLEAVELRGVHDGGVQVGRALHVGQLVEARGQADDVKRASLLLGGW